jgi:hypothetical protein
MTSFRGSPLFPHKPLQEIYLPTARGVDIVRVLHGARDIHGILAEEFGIESEE